MTTAKSNEAQKRDLFSPLATGEDLDPDHFPSLVNMSAAWFFTSLPRPTKPKPPEYVYVETKATKNGTVDIRAIGELAHWNLAWEAAQLRYDLFRKRLPKEWRWLRQLRDQNIYLVPKVAGPEYFAFSSLFHLLPRGVLLRYGLPPLKRGLWPETAVSSGGGLGRLPPDFNERLRSAFASHIWRFIDTGSRLSAFSQDDPLKLLAHNLDFWLPYINQVAEARLSGFERVKYEDEKQKRAVEKVRNSVPPDIQVDRPRMGGAVWYGEDDALQATKELIEAADARGRLRGIIDAVRSARIQDDFSSKWSWAKEDFERKLYSKRAKVKISFVELTETIPVLGPDSEVEGDLLWEDFLSLLDAKERRIVVLLRSGTTKLGHIATELGYANHSPVSKALGKVQRKARDYFRLP